MNSSSTVRFGVIVVATLAGVTFAREGRYTFSALLDEELVSERAVAVILEPPPAAA